MRRACFGEIGITRAGAVEVQLRRGSTCWPLPELTVESPRESNGPKEAILSVKSRWRAVVSSSGGKRRRAIADPALQWAQSKSSA